MHDKISDGSLQQWSFVSSEWIRLRLEGGWGDNVADQTDPSPRKKKTRRLDKLVNNLKSQLMTIQYQQQQEA